MSLPVVARLIKLSINLLLCLKLWLSGVFVITLQSCVTTPDSNPSRAAATESWQEVIVRDAAPSQSVEYCEIAVDPAICTLIEKITSEIRFQSASPALEPDALVSLEQAVEPLLNNQLRLSVTTYIDDTGEELLDVLLAKRRTLTVIRFLSNRGVPLGWLQPREPVFPAVAETVTGQQIAQREIEMRVLQE